MGNTGGRGVSFPWSMLAVLGCAPQSQPQVTPPQPLTTAACPPARLSDIYELEDINTRTGCVIVTKALGAVEGAADLALPIALVRSEGNAPSAEVYPQAWFGVGEWLSSDEYITEDRAAGTYTLHTPRGDAVYDFPVKVPGAVRRPNGPVADDGAVPLDDALRTRPFDGTFLVVGTNSYWIFLGNPYDRQTVMKEYFDPLPGKTTRLLTRLSKASIYQGPENEILIERNYAGNGPVSVTFRSSLYEGTGLTPLVVTAALPRTDGKAGFEVRAEMTMLHGARRTATVRASANGNVDSFESQGLKAGETHRATFAYYDENTPHKTVLRSMTEQEGSGADQRVLKSVELSKRALALDPRPHAVHTIVDRSIPGAPQTHRVDLCQKAAGGQAQPEFLTFNYASGGSAAYQYGTDDYRNLPIRTVDAHNLQTTTTYNPMAGGLSNDQQSRIPETGLEVKVVHTGTQGAKEIAYTYRYDRFSVETYRLPFVGKIGFERADRTGPAVYRAAFGDYLDEYADRKSRTFDQPFSVAGDDGRVTWEYRGLDGFVHEKWDEDGVETRFRLVPGDKDKETMEIYVMGSRQGRVTRDRFGRVLETVEFEPSLGAAAQPTTSFLITADGFTREINDSSTGEKIEILGWNGIRDTVTRARWSRAGFTLSEFDQPTDDEGNLEGTGTASEGPLLFTTTAVHGAGGVLEQSSIVGPDGRAIEVERTYNGASPVPAGEKFNGQDSLLRTPMPATAKGGCK